MTPFPATTTSTGRISRRHVVWLIGVVFVIALLARVGVGLVRFAQRQDAPTLEFPDEHQYWHIASSIARGDGMVDELGFRAGRMPLYPAILSLFVSQPGGIAPAKALQWIGGALAAPVIALLGLYLSGHRVGVLAGLAVALDPFLSFFASLLLTETFSITAICILWLMLALLCFPIRPLVAKSSQPTLVLWMWAGLIASVCVYLRESNLGLVLLGIVFVVVFNRQRTWQVTGGTAAVMLVVASLIPWAVRNKMVLGEWIWLTTRSGVSLYDGVGPQATGASDLGGIQSSEKVAGLTEVEWNRHFTNEAWMAVRDDPVRIVRLARHKLSRMWNPFPNVETYQTRTTRWVSILWTLPLYLLAIFGIFKCIRFSGRHGWSLVLFLLLPALYFSFLHALYVGSVRYRLPAMPMVTVLAAMAFMRPSDHRSCPEHDRESH